MRIRRGFCNHFRSMSEHKTCSAGVAYETLRGATHDKCPCFFKGDPPTEKSTLCTLAVYPTPQELAERDAWVAKRFEGVGKAREAIVKACGGPWKRGQSGSSGTIDCPVCGSQKALGFMRSGYNGHIHAACKTEGCVSWME